MVETGDRPNASIPSTSRPLAARYPAVYLADAILAIVAILEVRGMNNLRVCNGRRSSNPTRASSFFGPKSIS